MVRAEVNIHDDTFNRDKWVAARGGLICPFGGDACGRFDDVRTITQLDAPTAALFLESVREFSCVITEERIRKETSPLTDSSISIVDRTLKRITDSILT